MNAFTCDQDSAFLHYQAPQKRNSHLETTDQNSHVGSLHPFQVFHKGFIINRPESL
jgi:Cu/Zn superoxide dismutase